MDADNMPIDDGDRKMPHAANSKVPADPIPKKFACPNCSKRFLTQPGLDYHVNNTHGDGSISTPQQFSYCLTTHNNTPADNRPPPNRGRNRSRSSGMPLNNNAMHEDELVVGACDSRTLSPTKSIRSRKNSGGGYTGVGNENSSNPINSPDPKKKKALKTARSKFINSNEDGTELPFANSEVLVTQGGSTRKTRPGSKRLRSKVEDKKQKAAVGGSNCDTLVGDGELLSWGGMGGRNTEKIGGRTRRQRAASTPKKVFNKSAMYKTNLFSSLDCAPTTDNDNDMFGMGSMGGGGVQQWVQCGECDLWRKLPPDVYPSQLPTDWNCSMNTWNDSRRNCCNAPQEEEEESADEDDGADDMDADDWIPEESGDEEKTPPSTKVKAVKKKAPRGKKKKGKKGDAKCDMKPPPQQVGPQPQLPIGRDPPSPVVPIPQIDKQLDEILLAHTQSIHQIIERGEVYTLPRNALLEKELRTPATIEEIKSISSDNHWGTASCMVADRLGMKSHHFQEDNHTHKSLQDITQKTVAIRRLRQFIGSKISRVEHAKMILDVAFNYRSDYADGLPPAARALLNQGAPPNHRNSRFHQQNYATTKELKLMTKRERIHNNGCRPNSCCPLTMNCLIPMYMKELAGDKCLSKFQLTPDDLNQGDNYWFVLDNDDGSQSSFKRIITRQALEFCGCSYLEVILVSQYDLALKHELCLTVYGTPGMTLISSVYATDLKLFDTRMKEMNLYSAVCTLLMLYPHMENLITERVIVMYNEEHLVKLDECLLYFLGPLLGIDKVFPVISQWRAENMPPGARAELRKIKLALLAKARAVLKETRRAYKAGEELTPKQKKTIAKLDKKYENERDLWKRYKNGEVFPIHEEVRINAILPILMDKARKAVNAGDADDKQKDSVARQDEGGENGRDTMDKARKAVKKNTADDDQQDSVARQDEGGENGRDTMDKAREAVKDGTADDDQRDTVAMQQSNAETRKMSNQVELLKTAVKAGKGVDVVKCNRKDSCGDLLYVEEDSCKNKDFPTAPPRGTIYRIQKSCSCCPHKSYIFEERLSKAETNRLYNDLNKQLVERIAATAQKKKERKKKRKSNSETEANEPKKKRKK